ncbi:hypothetical protein HY469_00160 [Candidatus Roizmanbacteria bacterium]|nr:hypothetical protein [Candidatus Roizmanbacteria bacterium]
MVYTTGLVVDIDDTLADTARTIITKTYHKFGYSPPTTPDDLVHQYMQPGNVSVWKKSTTIQQWIQKMLTNDTFLRSIPPVPESNLLHEISLRRPVCCYLTSRLEKQRNVTEGWLELYGFPRAPTIFRDRRETHHQWKLAYLYNHAPNTFGIIDDSYSMLVHYPNYKGHRMWFNRYTTKRKEKQISSLSTWKEILVYITSQTN